MAQVKEKLKASVWRPTSSSPIGRRQLLSLGAGLLCPLTAHANAAWFPSFTSLRRHCQTALLVKALPSDLEGHGRPVHFEQANGKRYTDWFDWDGGILDIQLNGQGQAIASMKRLETPGFIKEQQAGQVLYPSYGTATTKALRKILRRQFKNVANTNVISLNDQLYALVESSPPTMVNKETLARAGENTFGGVIKGGFSAHPHRHADGKTVFNVGMELGLRPNLHVYAMRQSKQCQRLLTISNPHSAMLHDFADSDYMVQIQPPLHLDFKRSSSQKGPSPTV